MSINLTDEIEVKTKKGKLGAAKQIFLEGDTQTVEKEIQDINSRHNTLNTKHESLSRTVQGIAATGGASTANNVTYNNSSGLNAENAQDAIDELVKSLKDEFSYKGIAKPTTNPGVPDSNVFYIAGEGSYPSFNNQVVEIGQIAVLKWDGSWHKEVLEIGAGGGNMILDWNTDVATTRNQVLSKYRKPGVQISYENPETGWINEQYVGTSITNTEWSKDKNWEEIPNQSQLSNLDVHDFISVEHLQYTQQNNKYVDSSGSVIDYQGLLLLTYNMPKSKKLYVKRNTFRPYESLSKFLIVNDNGTKTNIPLKADNLIESIDLSSYSDNSEILINNYIGANNYVIVCGVLEVSFPEVTAKEVNFSSSKNSGKTFVQPINLINPSEIEKNMYYSRDGIKRSFSSNRYGTIEILVTFGKTYYIFGNMAGDAAYNVIVDKKGVVLKSTQSRVILIDDVNAYSLRLSVDPTNNEVGAFEECDVFSPYVDNTLFKNPVEIYGDKNKTNLFNKYRLSTKKECILNGAYNTNYNMSLARIPIERNKVYCIKVPAPNYYSPKQCSELAILSEDNRVIDESSKTLGQLSVNQNMTACQYSVAETLNINGEVYNGNIYLAINTYFENSKLDIRDTLLIQEDENITELLPMYYFPKYDVPLLMIRHCFFGDSISQGVHAPYYIPEKVIASCFDKGMYSVANKTLGGSAIDYVLNQLLKMDEKEIKSFNLFTIQHGTNCPMDANAESNAIIPTETFADIPYTYGDDIQVNTIEEHLGRFGTDVFSVFCKCIEYIRYYNLRAKVILITVPVMKQNLMEETNVNIKKIAKLYGLDVIDAASYAGISRRTTKAYSEDKVHFKDEYGTYQWFSYIGAELYNKMRGVLNPY